MMLLSLQGNLTTLFFNISALLSMEGFDGRFYGFCRACVHRAAANFPFVNGRCQEKDIHNPESNPALSYANLSPLPPHYHANPP